MEGAMQWLTALLAFAVTMLIFAIIVSTFVELIHRLLGYRSQGLRLMLESLYERVIKDRLSGPDKPTAQKFADIIMENRALASQPEAKGRIRKFLHWLVDSSVVSDIPVEVFTQKLADNRIVSATDNWTDNIVADIAQKYEAFGNEASSYFQRRARVLSVVIAFIIAWLFYVHPYNLAVTYFKNPEIAQSVADKAAEAHADYRALQERLEMLAASGPGVGEGTEELKSAIDELKQKIEEANQKANELADLGVPIGWPSQEGLSSCNSLLPGSDCVFSAFGTNWTRPSFGSAIWLLVGGLLVGLGAPFWAQAVSSLTASRDVTRKITEIVSPGSIVTAGGLGARSIGLAPGTQPTSVASFTLSQRAAGQAEVNKAAVATAGKPVRSGDKPI
jgi:hypothetical protein